MPVLYACECGKTTKPGKDGLVELGVIEKRYYCEDCAPVAEEYVAARDKLHDEIAKKWRDGVAKLQRAARKKHPDLRLPDVP